MLVGYARVSSTGQNLTSQIEALEKQDVRILQEKKSGTKSYNHPELQNALDFAHNGDILIVTRLDRCSRNVKDLHQIIETLNNKMFFVFE